MRTYSFIQNIVCGSTLMFLIGCIPIGPLTEPYTVAQYRQEENYFYVPTSNTPPMLSEKNDFSLNVQRSTNLAGENASSGLFEGQVALMPGKNVGVLANIAAGGDEYFSNVTTFKSEFGAGYVKKLKHDFHFETYGGMGFGKIENRHETGTSIVKSTHFFLQPTIGYLSPSGKAAFSLTSRFTGVSFKIDTLFDGAREPFSKQEASNLLENPFHLFWEPGFQASAGWKIFHVYAGINGSVDLSSPEAYRIKDKFAIGVVLRLNTGKKSE